jgi:hypothetical protein
MAISSSSSPSLIVALLLMVVIAVSLESDYANHAVDAFSSPRVLVLQLSISTHNQPISVISTRSTQRRQSHQPQHRNIGIRTSHDNSSNNNKKKNRLDGHGSLMMSTVNSDVDTPPATDRRESLSSPAAQSMDHDGWDSSIDITMSSSTTTRRTWIRRSAALSLALLMTSGHYLIHPSSPAWAKYGESSSMELPSYIDYLIEKNRAVDDSQVLYRGADPAVLLGRLQDSLKRLNEVPSLADEKKWTQIRGMCEDCVVFVLRVAIDKKNKKKSHMELTLVCK